MSATADAVIIGGGVNGVSAAYSLAKAGVKNVTLVEKGHIASRSAVALLGALIWLRIRVEAEKRA